MRWQVLQSFARLSGYLMVVWKLGIKFSHEHPRDHDGIRSNSAFLIIVTDYSPSRSFPVLFTFCHIVIDIEGPRKVPALCTF